MTNEELKKLSDDTFFDNDTGEIQPAGHRNFNNHLIDHMDTLCEATLRNSKGYTDARETAILAAADTKDADTLKTAKAYADRIVAALAGSAPEALNTLQELAAALGGDPNFATTVLQQIGERVTTEALNNALGRKADAPEIIRDGDLNNLVSNGLYTVDGSAILNAPVSTLNCRVLVIAAIPYRTTQIAQPFDSDRLFFRRRIDTMWQPWMEIWHSGNFNPNGAILGRGMGHDVQLDTTDVGTGFQYYQANCGVVGPFISFGHPGYIVQITTNTSTWQNGHFNIKYRVRNGNTGAWSDWLTFYHSGNLKPTYHAQINPQGQIVSQSTDWIQSVKWADNGNGYRCDIVPKVSVNAATVQVSAVASGGNTWPDYKMPIIYDTLVNGAIVVGIVNKDGASSQNWFNISVQGA